jgi:hypothetical protein
MPEEKVILVREIPENTFDAILEEIIESVPAGTAVYKIVATSEVIDLITSNRGEKASDAKHFDDELACPHCPYNATFKTKNGVTAKRRLTAHLIGNLHLLQGEELQRIIGIALENAKIKWQEKHTSAIS